MRVVAGLVGAVLLVSAPGAGAQMYKCVDERGRTSYSDKPRPGCRGGEVTIKPIPPISGEERRPASDDVQRADQEFRRRQIERTQKAEKESRERDAQEKRCAALRLERSHMEVARRVYVPDGKGGRVPMDDAARAERISRLDADLAQACR